MRTLGRESSTRRRFSDLKLVGKKVKLQKLVMELPSGSPSSFPNQFETHLS
jgi:hypothetical protein